MESTSCRLLFEKYAASVQLFHPFFGDQENEGREQRTMSEYNIIPNVENTKRDVLIITFLNMHCKGKKRVHE
jgi:hypothetical protein